MSKCLTCGCGLPVTGHGRKYCSRECYPSGRRPHKRRETDLPVEPTQDHEELIALLWEAARRGKVTAIRSLLALEKQGSMRIRSRPRSIIDELAERHHRMPDG